MTDQEFVELLSATPRELTWEEVELKIIESDNERGEYVANQIVHHNYGESRG